MGQRTHVAPTRAPDSPPRTSDPGAHLVPPPAPCALRSRGARSARRSDFANLLASSQRFGALRGRHNSCEVGRWGEETHFVPRRRSARSTSGVRGACRFGAPIATRPDTDPRPRWTRAGFDLRWTPLTSSSADIPRCRAAATCPPPSGGVSVGESHASVVGTTDRCFSVRQVQHTPDGVRSRRLSARKGDGHGCGTGSRRTCGGSNSTRGST
jgi:hypothetical protein